MTVVSLCLIACGLMTAWHFIYDGIILPSLRLKMRFELFAMRDELRVLSTTHEKHLDEDVFLILHDGINSTLNRLHALTLSTLARVDRAVEENDEIRERIEIRAKKVNSCYLSEIQDIDKHLGSVIERAFFLNAAGWVAYLLPIAFGMILMNKIASTVKWAMHAPESEWDRVVPPSSAGAI